MVIVVFLALGLYRSLCAILHTQSRQILSRRFSAVPKTGAKGTSYMIELFLNTRSVGALHTDCFSPLPVICPSKLYVSGHATFFCATYRVS